MSLRVLGSSSAGNCTLVWNERHAVIVDCGFSPRYLSSQLELLDLDLPAIAGLLITHVHGDHVNDYARTELITPLKRMYPSIARASRLGMLRDFDGNGVEVGSLEVSAFPVPHDAPGGCFGFTIAYASGRVHNTMTIATDLGYPSEGLLDWFRDSRVIVIESNHDIGMLERSGRPEWLKRRIREIGHLSNDQCAGFLAEIVRARIEPPRNVVLAHISQQCNTNELACRASADALRREGCDSVGLVETHRASPSAIVEF
jgi:phosphoribosyl 1,2-cyclic phosphodiesterase